MNRIGWTDTVWCQKLQLKVFNLNNFFFLNILSHFLMKGYGIVKAILVGHIFWIPKSLDQAMLNQNSLVTVFLDGPHIMGDQNGGLTTLLALHEIVITLALEGLVTNC